MELMTTEKTGNLTTWAADINAAHADAVKHASSAIGYAKTAGELLLRVKQKLPHGAFGGWLEANVTVSERQAQRYMAVAQGKPVPIREIAKSDTVSDLPAIAMRPKDEAKELARVQKELNESAKTMESLEYAVLMSKVQHLPENERAEGYETINKVYQLRSINKAVTKERDSLMTEAFHLKRTLAQGRREIDRLKKAA